MDKGKIKSLCGQCLSALEAVCVAGEQNQIQLMGVRHAIREIIKETDKEASEGGR